MFAWNAKASKQYSDAWSYNQQLWHKEMTEHTLIQKTIWLPLFFLKYGTPHRWSISDEHFLINFDQWILIFEKIHREAK